MGNSSTTNTTNTTSTNTNTTGLDMDTDALINYYDVGSINSLFTGLNSTPPSISQATDPTANNVPFYTKAQMNANFYNQTDQNTALQTQNASTNNLTNLNTLLPHSYGVSTTQQNVVRMAYGTINFPATATNQVVTFPAGTFNQVVAANIQIQSISDTRDSPIMPFYFYSFSATNLVIARSATTYGTYVIGWYAFGQ